MLVILYDQHRPGKFAQEDPRGMGPGSNDESELRVVSPRGRPRDRLRAELIEPAPFLKK
jgi:hypothetical protein